MSSNQGFKNIDSKATEKTSWCRSVRCNDLRVNHKLTIPGIKACPFGEKECRGAHAKKDISVPKHMRDWEKMADKSSICLLTIRDDVINAITQAKDNVVNPKYASEIHTIGKMDFVQLLRFWYDISCYHGRIVKELPSRGGYKGSVQPELNQGYRFKQDVPRFNVKNEDTVWALERTLHGCDSYINMMANKHIPHQFMSVCCGEEHSCKFGEHNLVNIACIDDLLNGSCSCMTKETITMEKTRIQTEIASLKTQLTDSVDAEGFKVKLNPKVRAAIVAKITSLDQEESGLFRRLHYSDQGMVSLAQRIKTNEESKIEMKIIDVATIEIVTPVKKIVKKKY